MTHAEYMATEVSKAHSASVEAFAKFMALTMEVYSPAGMAAGLRFKSKYQKALREVEAERVAADKAWQQAIIDAGWDEHGLLSE